MTQANNDFLSEANWPSPLLYQVYVVNSLISSHICNFGNRTNPCFGGIALYETLSTTNNVASFFSLRLIECVRRELQGSKAMFFFFSADSFNL